MHKGVSSILMFWLVNVKLIFIVIVITSVIVHHDTDSASITSGISTA